MTTSELQRRSPGERDAQSRELALTVDLERRIQRADARAERLLAAGASEERYRTLIEQAPDAFFGTDASGAIREVNAAAVALSGFTRGELVGAPIERVLSAEDVARLPAMRALLARGRAGVLEWTIVRRDGRRVPVEASVTTLPDGTWQAFARDVTERKRVEAERDAMAARARGARGGGGGARGGAVGQSGEARVSRGDVARAAHPPQRDWRARPAAGDGRARPHH